MRKIQFSLILVLFYSMLFASQIDIQRAQTIAKNIYYERVNLNKNVDYKQINLTHVYTETKDGYNLYYIFNVNENEGYVIVSADNVVKPIISYSYERNYRLTNISPEHSFYMNKYKNQIYDAITKNIKPSDEVIRLWQRYEFSNKSVNDIQSIQPLLLTIWGQSYPYNEMCPSNSNGQAVVGCVAVSFAQLMKYYNYPAQGNSTHSYYDYTYGTQTANYGATQYHFENIPNDASGSNEYLARLLYHCGVAVNMSYGVDGSGSQTTRIVTGLENYFKYSTDANYVAMDNYSATGWLDLLRAQIDNGWPMSYDGYSDAGGHAWNCDGYEGDELHMNWGWDGYYNGFYAVSDLNPDGTGAYTTEGAVINVYPIANYPEGCSSKTITGTTGSIEDGSGNTNYLNNLNCTYHFLPECGTYVTLDFDRFLLGDGDHLYVYNGSSTSSPLLADYTNVVTSPANVTSTTEDGLLINFVTDGSDNAEGWYLSYTTKKCKSTTTVTEPYGEIEDGSKVCDYNNSSLCKWNLEPVGAVGITINFTEFALQDANDYVKIYKGLSTLAADLIEELRVGDVPTTINVPDPKATVRFVTSGTGETNSGWKLTYGITTNVNSINNFVDDVNVYPNPFNNDANIQFNSTTNNLINVSIVDLLGEKLGEVNNYYSNGVNNIKVSEIVKNINQGIYFVKFTSDNLEKTIKIVVTK